MFHLDLESQMTKIACVHDFPFNKTNIAHPPKAPMRRSYNSLLSTLPPKCSYFTPSAAPNKRSCHSAFAQSIKIPAHCEYTIS